MAIEEEYKQLRTKWKNDIKLQIDNYPNLKYKRSNNLNKAKIGILCSPFHGYNAPASENDKCGRLRNISNYEIVINVMGNYVKEPNRKEKFYLAYPSDDGFNYPVKVHFGSEILNLAQAPNSKYLNWTTDLRNDIRRITEAHRWSDFFVRYSHLYIKEILWSCNEHLGVWKDKKGLVGKLDLEEKDLTHISNHNANEVHKPKEYNFVPSKNNPAVSGCYIRG